MDPYTFEYQGLNVTYQRGTVRTGMESTRLRRKLISALGYETEMPSDEYANVDTYAETMSRSTVTPPENVTWWCHSNMTEDQIKAAFDVFLEEDEELYALFNRAYVATLPPKKTTLSTPPTLPT
jgi:hypothetical protein